jgi:hypothetical protein
MAYNIQTELLDKEVEANGEMVSVFGMAHFRVSPKRIGLGRLSLDLFKKFCDKPIIGFVADDNILSFYLKCGWFECGEFDGLKAVCSVQMKITFTEKW